MVRILVVVLLLIPSILIAQPSSFDWRDVSGINYVTPVRNMSPTGSCWAFAAVGALESKVVIAGLASRETLDLAEQVLHSCCVWCGGCGGGTVSMGLDYIVSTGLPTELCVPFTVPCVDYWDGTPGRCGEGGITKCSTYQSQVYKVDSYTSVSPVTIANIRSAIYNYGPVVIEFNLCNDYKAWDGQGVFNYDGSSPCSGKHNTILVGWNDTGSYFISKDEYGTSYGQSGYQWLGYSNVGSGMALGQPTYYLGTASFSGITTIIGGTVRGGTIR